MISMRLSVCSQAHTGRVRWQCTLYRRPPPCAANTRAAAEQLSALGEDPTGLSRPAADGRGLATLCAADGAYLPTLYCQANPKGYEHDTRNPGLPQGELAVAEITGPEPREGKNKCQFVKRVEYGHGCTQH